jgi:hypothetical protein
VFYIFFLFFFPFLLWRKLHQFETEPHTAKEGGRLFQVRNISRSFVRTNFQFRLFLHYQPLLCKFVTYDTGFGLDDWIYCTLCIHNGSRDSVVGIATGYGLDGRGVGVRVPVRSRIFLLHVVQTDSEIHPTSYLLGTGGAFPGAKAAGA